MTQWNRIGRSRFAVVLAFAAACGNGAEQSRIAWAEAADEQIAPAAPGAADPAGAASLSAAFRDAARRAMPAVVRIDVATREAVSDGHGGYPFVIPGMPEVEPERRALGTGSGILVDAAGHILTNNHVVENAERVTVALADGREYEARVVGGDADTDVAVIRIDPADGGVFPHARLGDSDSLDVGDWVLALGNPMGLEFTVTAGIVSATDRSIGILQGEQRGAALEAFIQTDAAINPGNSGGPLVDLLGRVVGINSAIESRTGYFTGAGFAIPINLARRVAEDLIEYGVVNRPRLGVTIQNVNSADAELYRLPEVTGAEIAAVTPGEAADRAGVRMGDVVIRIEGEPIGSVTDLQATVARYQPGQRVRLGIIRFGERLERTVELGAFERRRSGNRHGPAAESAPGFGLLVRQLDALASARLGLAPRAHLFIAGTDPFGPAAQTVPAGVVLVRINGTDVRTARDLGRLERALERGQIVSVVVLDPRAESPAPTVYNYRIR
jgi:serine protease Do